MLQCEGQWTVLPKRLSSAAPEDRGRIFGRNSAVLIFGHAYFV